MSLSSCSATLMEVKLEDMSSNSATGPAGPRHHRDSLTEKTVSWMTSQFCLYNTYYSFYSHFQQRNKMNSIWCSCVLAAAACVCLCMPTLFHKSTLAMNISTSLCCSFKHWMKDTFILGIPCPFISMCGQSKVPTLLTPSVVSDVMWFVNGNIYATCTWNILFMLQLSLIWNEYMVRICVFSKPMYNY